MPIPKTPKLFICFISLEFFWSFNHQKSFLGHRARAELIPLSPSQISSFYHNVLRLRGAGIESQRKDARYESSKVADFMTSEVTKTDLTPFPLSVVLIIMFRLSSASNLLLMC